MVSLKQPPFPSVAGGAVYFFVQSGHAQSAVQLIADIIADQRHLETSDPFFELSAEFASIGAHWAMEALLQGAFLKYYHMWETVKSHPKPSPFRVQKPPPFCTDLSGEKRSYSDAQRIAALI